MVDETSGVLVSVVVPTHDRARVVTRAIDSVLSQTHAALELIVVDDGSTDGTRELLDTITDARLRRVDLATRRGANHARNLGIGMARGEFVAFLDSDDEWLPAKLEIQLDAFGRAGKGVGVVYTDFVMVNQGTGRSRRANLPPPGVLFQQLLTVNVVGTCSTPLVRRSCFDVAGRFDEAFPAFQDQDMWLRLARACTFLKVNEPLVRYHVQDDSITANHRVKIQGCKRLAWKYGNYMNASQKAFHHRNLSLYHRRAGNIARAWLARGISLWFDLVAVGPRGAAGAMVSHLKGPGRRRGHPPVRAATPGRCAP